MIATYPSHRIAKFYYHEAFIWCNEFDLQLMRFLQKTGPRKAIGHTSSTKKRPQKAAIESRFGYQNSIYDCHFFIPM